MRAAAGEKGQVTGFKSEPWSAGQVNLGPPGYSEAEPGDVVGIGPVRTPVLVGVPQCGVHAAKS